MAKLNRLESGLTDSEKKRISSFSDFIFNLYLKVGDECESKGVEPMGNELYCRLSECVGAIEQLIQDEF